MRRTVTTIAALLLALGAIEGLAYWWMHPAPAGLGEPVLVYRPSRSVGVPPTSQNPGTSDQETGIRGQVTGGDSAQEEASAPELSSNPKSTIINHQSPPLHLPPLLLPFKIQHPTFKIPRLPA